MGKRSLTLAEQETILRRSADEDHWEVYSCNPSMVKKLRRISIQMGLSPTKVDDYGYRFTLPLNAVSFRAPRKATEAQREHLARIGAKAKEAAGHVSR